MNSSSKPLAFLVLVAVAPLVQLACGGKQDATPPPNGAYNTWQTQPSAGPTAPPPGPATVPVGTPPPTGPATVPPTGPATAPPTTASASPSAALSAQAVVAALTPLAAKDAPGMQPEGQPLTAQLAEGQHTDMTVNMVGGKCYTVIGASVPGVGVKDLKLTLLTPPFYTVSAGDSTKGAAGESVIGAGSKPTCPLLPVPVAYKLDVFAKSGSGPVAVQVYSKTK